MRLASVSRGLITIPATMSFRPGAHNSLNLIQTHETRDTFLTNHLHCASPSRTPSTRHITQGQVLSSSSGQVVQNIGCPADTNKSLAGTARFQRFIRFEKGVRAPGNVAAGYFDTKLEPWRPQQPMRESSNLQLPFGG